MTDDWPPEMLAAFASQYGSPQQYTLIQRAKLIGVYGVMARLADQCQMAALAPYCKANHPPQSLLSDNRKKKQSDVMAVSKTELDELLGIGRKQ